MAEGNTPPLSSSISPSIFYRLSVSYSVRVPAVQNYDINCCIPGNRAAYPRICVRVFSFKAQKQFFIFHMIGMVRLRSVWHCCGVRRNNYLYESRKSGVMFAGLSVLFRGVTKQGKVLNRGPVSLSGHQGPIRLYMGAKVAGCVCRGALPKFRTCTLPSHKTVPLIW